MAGFPNSLQGVWAFVDIKEGDFASFLYGAKAYNLYRVVKKAAVRDFKEASVWKPVTHQSGRTYHFPFRLYLIPLRQFCEPIVRPEFAYIAKNLLLRGGYRRTYFQADQTTLQCVSQMGNRWSGVFQPVTISSSEIFEPRFTPNKQQENIPFVTHFQELILHAAVRRHLSDTRNLSDFFGLVRLDNLEADEFEVLGEKALSEGHVDILIKDRVPVARRRMIVVEVKRGVAQPKDITQLRYYMDELGDECVSGVLIAKDFSKSTISQAAGRNIHLVRYRLALDWRSPQSFAEIVKGLRLEKV